MITEPISGRTGRDGRPGLAPAPEVRWDGWNDPLLGWMVSQTAGQTVKQLIKRSDGRPCGRSGTGRSAAQDLPRTGCHILPAQRVVECCSYRLVCQQHRAADEWPRSARRAAQEDRAYFHRLNEMNVSDGERAELQRRFDEL